jgi:hypothetical protein
MALIATRRRGFEANVSPSTGLARTQGRQATMSGTTGGGATVLFNPGDLGAYSAVSGVGGVFPSINNNGAPTILQSTVTRPGGSSKAIRIAYDTEDDGVELYVNNWTPSQSVYTRWYMMFGSEWATYWPVGLKTCRYYTYPDGTVVVGDPGAHGTVYCSTKFVWQRYPPPTDVGLTNAPYVWGLNHACNNMEVPTAYSASTLFNNGLPYIRAGVWYKFETWMVLNSAVNANDGILQSWVDDQLVFSNTAWPWANVGNAASNPGGQARQVDDYGSGGWCRMWFGGNISANHGFGAGGTLYRYEDGYYLSTTLDR